MESHDEELFGQAMSEIEDGKMSQGLWAMAFAKSEGNINKAKASYILLRVESLKSGGQFPPAGQEMRTEVISAEYPLTGAKVVAGAIGPGDEYNGWVDLMHRPAVTDPGEASLRQGKPKQDERRVLSGAIPERGRPRIQRQDKGNSGLRCPKCHSNHWKLCSLMNTGVPSRASAASISLSRLAARPNKPYKSVERLTQMLQEKRAKLAAHTPQPQFYFLGKLRGDPIGARLKADIDECVTQIEQHQKHIDWPNTRLCLRCATLFNP